MLLVINVLSRIHVSRLVVIIGFDITKHPHERRSSIFRNPQCSFCDISCTVNLVTAVRATVMYMLCDVTEYESVRCSECCVCPFFIAIFCNVRECQTHDLESSRVPRTSSIAAAQYALFLI